MQRFRVLYAGTNRAGRTTSVGWLARPCPVLPWDARRDRLEAKEISLSSGETILLDVVVPNFGSAGIRSYEQATHDEEDWIREVGRNVLAFLPTIDGVVFVAESWRVFHRRNGGYFKWVLRELALAGLDVDRLPFVFQLNKRDHVDVISFDQLATSFVTPRCAHVESIAPCGYGVITALDTLVRLIRGGDSTSPTYLPRPASGVEPELTTPRRFFTPTRIPLTQDGLVLEETQTSTLPSLLHVGESAIALAWNKVPVKSAPLVPGEYLIDVTERLVTVHDAERPRTVVRRVMAARTRLRDATAVEYDLLAPRGEYYHSCVLVGAPEAVGGLKETDVPRPLDHRIQPEGALLFASRGGSLERAERGDVVAFHPGALNLVQIWLGRDASGRPVEIACCGDEGVAMLERAAGTLGASGD